MRKPIAAAVVAASITIGGLGGAMLGPPVVLSGAQETTQSAAGWVQEALAGLVSDGTIDQDQADAVATALQEAKPDRPHRHHRHSLRISFQAAADALGMTPEELREAMDADTSIADVAAERAVEVQTVIDAIVAAHKEKLNEKVAAGELTQEEGDEKLARVTERTEELVNREFERRGPGGPGRRGGPGGPGAERGGEDAPNQGSDQPAEQTAA